LVHQFGVYYKWNKIRKEWCLIININSKIKCLHIPRFWTTLFSGLLTNNSMTNKLY
jgi:hypothetical protein